VSGAVGPMLGAVTAERTCPATEVRVVPSVGLSVPAVERIGVVAVSVTVPAVVVTTLPTV
jgi:hypothetical protein